MQDTAKWNIGCSGFGYKEWKGIFYPDKLPQNKFLAYYATQFNTLEVNVSFYRFPQLKMLQDWRLKTPDNFLFTVKAPRIITHIKQLTDTAELVRDFYKVCEDGLQEKLGPVLFQFPPSFKYTEETLQRILQSLDPAFINVVEFRHSSWWNEEVYTQLKQKDIIFCGINHPSLPCDVVINNKNIYYRFHGTPKIFYSEYTDKELKAIADEITGNSGNNIYCYFNNTASAAALTNARWLQQYTNHAALTI